MRKQVVFSVFCLLLMVVNVAFAQEDGYDAFRAKMSSVFQYVNKDKVPTGILSDYGLQLIEPNGFDGILTDTNYVDFSVWKQLYFGMYDSRINTKVSLQEPQLVYNNIKGRNSLAVMHFYYNKLDDNAVNKGLLRFENEQIKEVAGAASPYLQKELFAVSPRTTDFDSDMVSFTFDRQSYVSNTGLTVTRLEVKFGNETGYVEAQWGTPISHTFNSGGEKEICFRMTFSNGKSLSSRTKITVVAPAVFTRADGKTMKITPRNIPATASHSGGTMQVIFCNDVTNGKFIRPLVIAEDIEIPMFSENKGRDLNSLVKSDKFGPIISQLSQIYDIIYINNKDSLDDVNRNAALFRDAIKMINGNLYNAFGNTVADSTYVVGLGMGGLVARIALNMMETNNEQHRVRKLIAIDTPYKGLNMPVGLQAFVRHVQDIKIGKSQLGDLSGTIDQFVYLFDSKAMRQLLINYICTNMTYDKSDYQKIMNSPNMTRTPQLCQTIAVTGGSNTGKQLFSPGATLIDYHNSSALINSWFWKIFFWGGADLKIDFTAKALPNRQKTHVYDGRIYIKKKIFFWHVNINITHKEAYSESAMYPIDGASGNYLSLDSLKAKSSSLKDLLKISKFCYIPTVSALGLENWQERLSSYLSPTEEKSMCNRYYISGDNNDVTDLSAFQGFLISELTPKIVGATTILGDTELFVDNMPDIPLIKYTWNFKNNKLKVASQKGARAVVRPLSFGDTDILSVSASIPFIDQSINIPSVRLTSQKLDVLGETYISGLKNEYKLDRSVACDTVIWRTSEGVIIDSRRKDNTVIAYTEEELKNPWIEAAVIVDKAENKIRKELISKGLTGIELRCHDSWIGKNSKGETCKKYAFQVFVEPRDFPRDRLDFCWGSTIKKDNIKFVSLVGGAGLKTGGNIAFFGNCTEIAHHIDSMHIGFPLDSAHIVFPRDSMRVTVRPLPNSFSNGLPGVLPPLDKDIVYQPWERYRNTAIVAMPIVKDGETASGEISCKVSDYLGHEYLQSQFLSIGKNGRSYSSSPNPANSILTIQRTVGNDEPTVGTFSVATSETFVAALYNDFGMVRSITFDSSQTSVDMNVADLSAGTYYLNIIKNGNVIERQILFIKH